MRSLCGRLLGLATLGAAVVWLAGCSDGAGARATVKGKVKLGEKPLYTGTVIFTAKGAENRIGSGAIDQEGNYTIGDAPVGDVEISVSVPKMGMMGKMPGGVTDKAKPPPGVSIKDPSGGMAMTPTGVDPTKIVPIPDKYSNPATSGLTYKVEKGPQTHDIVLTP